MSNVKFTPVRCKESAIFNYDILPFNNGFIYFTTDEGKIYIDCLDDSGSPQRKAVGGSGEGGGSNSGIYYANKDLSEAEKLETEITFPKNKIEGDKYPRVDDLLFNTKDSSFYRVISVNFVTSSVVGSRLTVSGGGGGGTPTTGDPIDLHLESLDSLALINGASQKIYFTATSAKKLNGTPYDSKLTITWSLAYTDDGINYTTYKTDRVQVNSEELSSIEFGIYAKKSASSKLTLVASQLNASGTATGVVEFTTSDLTLELPSTFSNMSYASPDNITIQCNVGGNMDKIVEYFFDDLEIPFYTKTLDANSKVEQDPVSIKEKIGVVASGYHTVLIKVSQLINGQKGKEIDPIQYEIAVWDGLSRVPIIWLGNYQEQYYNYDTIQIPFRVFDPSSQERAVVHFKRNGNELSNSPQTITDMSKYSYFEISDAEIDAQNFYTISCGEGENEVSRKIEVKVVQDPTRTDFGIQKQSFLTYQLNTVGSGRSNSESETRRQTLVYQQKNPVTGLVEKEIAAKFTNFNWYNNGWVRDTDNKTCLRISNGAQLTIPVGQTVFANPNGDSITQTSHTIELSFKIRNVQDYSTLVKTITRYNSDDDLYALFYDAETGEYKTSYTNYDSFLAWYLKEHEYLVTVGTEQKRLTYDDLVFNRIEKQINLNNVVCGYYSGNSKSVKGLCLGPQDAFFSNGVNTVSVSYVEDEIVTLTMVYQYDGQDPTQHLIFVYLNGVLTGVTKSTSGAFTIENDNLIFKSDSCDIDLYKIRFYNAPLNVNDIVMNYAADFENVKIYDQNKLAKENAAIKEYQFSYDNMIQYNKDHPNAPLMPYIIFDTTKSNNDNKLSYAKSVNVPISVEFVNPGLELAYTSGEIEDLAKADGLWADGATSAEKEAAVKKYYMHHCPSWTGDNINMAVQGTSSEFYPRRNYKLKTKTKYDEDGSNRVHIFLNRGPFAEDYAADMFGLKQQKYIISSAPYNANIKYYEDNKGEKEVTFDINRPYEFDKYYIKNPDYVELGKEKTRQKYWYMDNYTCGTTKFTMKIDYMESSGSYNMGFANLVANGYSKHPLKDYSDAGAFCTGRPGEVRQITGDYDSSKVYNYYNHKGNIQGKVLVDPAGDFKNFDPTNAEHLAAFKKGPYALAQLLGVTKVLGGSKESLASVADVANITATEKEAVESNIAANDSDGWHITFDGWNKWYEVTPSTFQTFEIESTSLKDYRTSVKGFRTLAFHKKGENDYQYIGMYNMLLDKGSDECYGFALDKTTGKDVLQKHLDYQSIGDVAECWEFSNNSRTFCSFRDPLDRKDLQFDVYTMNGNNKVRTLNSVQSAPVVVDSFEYRYNTYGDMLDYIYNPDKEGDKLAACEDYMAANNVDFTFDKNDITKNQDDRTDFVLKTYKNWEKAVSWVWSTCIEKVKSQGVYSLANVGKNIWTPNTFYVYKEIDGSYDYVLDDGTSYDSTSSYYIYSGTDSDGNKVYENAYIGEIKFDNNTKYDLYIKVNDAYAACTADSVFDEGASYYTLQNYTDEQMEADGGYDRLVEQCKESSEFDENTIYYTYDGTKHCGEAVQKIDLTEEQFNANKTNYYVGKTITYGKKSYNYDTQEYRADKFVNELGKHFDLEYLATYFVMTEVFECYDSRGKNAMFASWGPQEAGGNYIWYPIFYDIDTQLGVNNTGIPSFEYNVDATEDGNYSTSDSVLWNNFYRYFKGSAILAKYKHLKGVTAGVSWPLLSMPPISSVDRIEAWYNTDPDVCGSLAMRGERPLVAVNLDEYYKYITITNKASYQNGVTGHISSDDKGTWTYDNGTYFYMLQGNRSLSRRQFLTNRIEYIDSWLNQGNYQRGGANRIRGRVAANNSVKTSDIWVETNQAPYYNTNGEKVNLFDAEYWLTLTPSHSSYVTLGDDNEAYPSRKYDGIHPLKFNVDAIEHGVRTSANYPEQLLYIYGINQMKDLGDMSNLYWQEFEISGDASKLTSLKLGYDGKDAAGNTWFNNNVNQPSFPSGATDTGMPLLKEVNMCNMQINVGTPVFDFSSCEKLENFRATGSNFEDITFADGVALNTLYLPSSIKSLKLTEARLLKNLITEYEYPQRQSDGTLKAKEGLYLQGMFENNGSTDIGTLNLFGGSLGYDSYKLLKQYYTIRARQTQNPSFIQMTNVNWSPYVRVTEDDIYDSTKAYYEDDGHYGFKAYSYNLNNWNTKVINGEIYYLDTSVKAEDISQITYEDINPAGSMFRRFADENDILFRGTSVNKIPNITGIIYVDNDTPVDEYDIRNTLQVKFPELKFFFKNVNKAYTARFLLMDADEGEDGRYTLIGSQTITSGWFDNPIDKYGDISKLKENHDFYGWALTNSIDADIIVNIDKSINNWGGTLTPGQYDYIFYAVCPIHSWDVTYYNHLGEIIEVKKVPHGEAVGISNIIPWKDDSELTLEETYKFLGYARTPTSKTLVDLNEFIITENTKLYAVFADNPISVYDNINEEYFAPSTIETSTKYSDQYDSTNKYLITQGTGIYLSLIKEVKGKITVPAMFNDMKVIGIDMTFSANEYGNTSSSTNVDSLKFKGKNLTHIFFAKNADGSCNIRQFGSYALSSSPDLKYVEFPEGLRTISNRAFWNTDMPGTKLPSLNDVVFPDSLAVIGASAFSNSFGQEVTELSFSGELRSMDISAFMFINTSKVRKITIGSQDNKSKLSFYQSGTWYIYNAAPENIQLTFYSTVYSDPSELSGKFVGVTIESLVH